ncbi:MAG: hypothetical protein QM619_05870 [Micropruina sp.]|uniref:hypothetical protein n=1 Tax=Micropruina sp. TaxID=2737536 RepID=UPI0039E4019C
MTSNPPTDQPEQRWQQPSFGPEPNWTGSVPPNPAGPPAPAPTPHPVHPSARQVPPASTVETVVGTLAKVVWPVAIVLLITTRMGFVPLVIIAIVANMLLGAIKKNLRQRRYASLPPSYPPPSDDLR